jgi:DNA-binding beta-propeller fold protein YncE
MAIAGAHSALGIILCLLVLTVSYSTMEVESADAALPQLKPFIKRMENIGLNVRNFALSSTLDKLYVVDGDWPNGGVRIYNATTLEELGNISLGGYPYSITMIPKTDWAYLLYSCNCDINRTITVIDTKADRISLNITDVPMQFYEGPHVNPLTSRVYVSDGLSITEIDGITNKIIRTTDFQLAKEDAVYLAAYNSLTNRLYGIDESKRIVEVDIASHKLSYMGMTIDSVPNSRAVDNYPTNMVVNPATNTLYIVNRAVFPPSSDHAGMQYPISYLIAIDTSSRKIRSHDILGELHDHILDFKVDSRSNILYFTGYNSLTAIDGFTDGLLNIFYHGNNDALSSMRKFIIDSENDLLYTMSPMYIGRIADITSYSPRMTYNENVLNVSGPTVWMGDVDQNSTWTYIGLRFRSNATYSTEPQPFTVILQTRDSSGIVTFVDIENGIAVPSADDVEPMTIAFNWTKAKYKYMLDIFVVDDVEHPTLLESSKYIMDDWAGDYYPLRIEPQQMRGILRALGECEKATEECDLGTKYDLAQFSNRCGDYWQFNPYFIEFRYYNPICDDNRLYTYEAFDVSTEVETITD